ncbi:Transmembrane protein [Parasponia andersonii]|uniref:Transmembrane protein n=1 Tax=Parasponia andersonii TaxID=3476 RepID=A0A2P5CPW6_PARAD|nr:Transmembrane protein [Parasponia andersonii]
MGQSLKKLAPGEEKKIKEIESIAEDVYKVHFGTLTADKLKYSVFYRAICETVEKINVRFGNTQFRIPSAKEVEDIYNKRHNSKKNQPVTHEEFKQILKEIMEKSPGFTGFGGAKDTLIYVFGVPVTTWFIKQQLIPRSISDDYFIPGVTSATVLLLANLNKL